MKRRLFNLLAGVSLAHLVASYATIAVGAITVHARGHSLSIGFFFAAPITSPVMLYMAAANPQLGLGRWRIWIYYWFFFAVGAGAGYLLWRSRMRRKQGLPENPCLICGYDVRATPDRCPECGVIPKIGP